MNESTATYQVIIKERRYGTPPVTNVMHDPTPEYVYVPIVESNIEDPKVLAGLLRSMADKLDPPRSTY